MSDDFDALDLVPAVIKIEVLQQEEAALLPLVSDLSLRLTGYLPRADQSI
jgi:hypothetical protein